MNLFDTIATAWKAFVAQKKLLPLIVFVDLLFFYGLARLHYEIFNRASAAAIRLTAMMGEQAQQLATAETMPSFAALESPEFMNAFHEVVTYISIFFAAAGLLWLVGKGITWFLAHKTAEKKTDLKLFAAKFLGMTLFWCAAFSAIAVLALNLMDYALFSTIPLIGETTANIIIALLLCALAYFVNISYALVPHRTFVPTFALGVKRWKTLVPVHVIGMLILFVAVTVPASLIKIDITLSLAFIIAIALPAIAWSRVFWITATQDMVRHG